MSYESQLVYALWFVTMVLEAGILAALFARGLHRQYARFTAYIAWQFVGDLFLLCVQRRPFAYYFGYWVVTAVSIALTLAILHQILYQVLRPLDSGHEIGSALVRSTVILALALFPMSLLATSGGIHIDVITASMLGADRYLRILVFGGGLGILMLGRRFGASQRGFSIGVVSGFVLFSFVHLMVATAMGHHTILLPSELIAIDLAGVALAEAVWLGYALLAPKVMMGGPAEISPSGSMPAGQAYAS